jgi:hypothetical protein
VESGYSTAPLGEVDSAPRPGLLLKNVHILYRLKFRHWFGITAPTSLLAAAVFYLANQRIRSIVTTIPRGNFHFAEFAEVSVLRFGSFFMSWLFGCFALAAIATVVNGLDGEDADTPWKHDSHQRAREHFGAIALAALFTFCVFLAGIAVAEFVEITVGRFFGWTRVPGFFYGATIVGGVVVASIVSWFGTAIPLIVRGNTTIWSALKRSVELSSGYEAALLWLVVETLLGSYLAWYATYYVLRLLFPVQLRHTVWYGWVVYALAVLATAAVDPPLFIGFSLLADPEPLNASSLPGSEQTT